MVHGWSEKRHNTTQDTPRDGIPGHRRGRVDVVAGDEVVIRMQEDEDISNAMRDGREDGEDPMDSRGIAGPGKDEQASRNEDSSNKDDDKASFGRAFPSIWIHRMTIIDFPCNGLETNSNKRSNTQAQKGEA